jgi:hypothetical protein
MHPCAVGGGEERGRLLEGEAVARSSGLAFGGLDERGDVASDEVPGLGVPDGAGRRIVAMATAALE